MKRLSPLALAVACASAAAGSNENPIEHVLVSVPVHKKAAETALPVTVLTGEELRRRATASIGDTLALSPGISNASFGPGVGQPVIRGQAGPRVTVLQNGTTSADAANLSADHAVAVEPLLADSIEVLRGPATLLYGGGAIGGVVNVIDNRIPTTVPGEVDATLEYRHDTASSGDTAVGRVDGGSGNFAWHASGLVRNWDDIEIPGMAELEHDDDHDDHDDDHDDHEGEEHDHDDEESTNGFIDNSDGQTFMGSLGGSYHFDSGFFGLAVSRLENEYGIPAGGHVHGHDEDHDEEHGDEEGHDEDHDEEEEENIRIDMEQTRYDAALHLHEPLPGVEVFRGFLTYTDYGHVELEGAEVGTEFSNETWETRLEFVHSPFGEFHGAFGLQAKMDEFSAVGEEAYVPVTDSTEVGLFLIEDYHNGGLMLEGGLRVDYVEREPQDGQLPARDFTSFSASGSAMYDLGDSISLGFALMRAERAPATEELYANATNLLPEEWVTHAATRAIKLGDVDLDTETSNNADLSLNWVRDAHSATVTLFYNDFADYINLVNTGLEVDETPVLAYVQQDAEFYGVELESSFRLASVADGELRLGLSADYIVGELDDGADVPRMPPLRIGGELAWISEHWNVFTRVLDAAEQDRAGDNEEETPGYTRWDAGLEYRSNPTDSRGWVAFVNLRNIGDDDIRLSTSFLRDLAPEPGRSVEAGIRLLF